MEESIAVIGVGYVGLQTAITLAGAGIKVIAFDTNSKRIDDLSHGVDNNLEAFELDNPNLRFTSDVTALEQANYYIISVPTPINQHLVPDIFALKSASKLVGETLKKGDVVILESTVFPGATRELMAPILEERSGLDSGKDFFLGYSSERIVPGDSDHNLSNTTKVISGQNDAALEKIKALYERVPNLKLHCAPSLEVAESSKLLENIQRDINIALMNEFAQIMDKMNISIYDVLDAAKTKWNFLPFSPGLVGGHCIPEDPYYLIYQANKIGAMSNLISCARQTNEYFYNFISQVTLRQLTKQEFPLKGAKVAILGISFKPNVTDIRHSLSITLYKNLESMGLHVVACDPMVHLRRTDLNWAELDDLNNCQAIIICQAHDQFLALSEAEISKKLAPNGVIIDIPAVFLKQRDFRSDINYWSI